MLDEYLNLYEQQADTISGWRKINKNELCNLYLKNEHNNKLKEAYFSAIVARYWPSMTKLYQRCSFGISVEDCYQWLIDSVLYALNHRPWLDKDSPLYEDPNGPDKVINRCLKSRRLTHYQLLNKDKRVANLNPISIDTAEDDFGDYVRESLGLAEENIESSLETTFNKMIKNCIEQRSYFIAILLDAVLYTDILSDTTEKSSDNLTLISKRKLDHLLLEESGAYIEDFISRHQISEDNCTDVKDFIRELSANRIAVLLTQSLPSLRTAKMRKLLYR